MGMNQETVIQLVVRGVAWSTNCKSQTDSVSWVQDPVEWALCKLETPKTSPRCYSMCLPNLVKIGLIVSELIPP